jgi:CRP-like cAMP-binding protein
MPRPTPTSSSENRLLAALPAGDRSRLLAHADEVTLDRGDLVFRANGPLNHVYLPRTGILSMVIDMTDGGTVEVATIGREGFAGLPVLLGTERSPAPVYCPVPPCVCHRVPAADFVAELRSSTALWDLSNRYAQAHLNLSAQSTACNSRHPVEERLARWLLMTHDRVGDDELNLTQQILSEMLGVRRSSVTTAAGILQRAGLIDYRRGRIRVLDRVGLETAARECYKVVRAEFERLLGSNGDRRR